MSSGGRGPVPPRPVALQAGRAAGVWDPRTGVLPATGPSPHLGPPRTWALPACAPSPAGPKLHPGSGSTLGRSRVACHQGHAVQGGVEKAVPPRGWPRENGRPGRSCRQGPAVSSDALAGQRSPRAGGSRRAAAAPSSGLPSRGHGGPGRPRRRGGRRAGAGLRNEHRPRPRRPWPDAEPRGRAGRDRVHLRGRPPAALDPPQAAGLAPAPAPGLRGVSGRVCVTV